MKTNAHNISVVKIAETSIQINLFYFFAKSVRHTKQSHTGFPSSLQHCSIRIREESIRAGEHEVLRGHLKAIATIKWSFKRLPKTKKKHPENCSESKWTKAFGIGATQRTHTPIDPISLSANRHVVPFLFVTDPASSPKTPITQFALEHSPFFAHIHISSESVRSLFVRHRVYRSMCARSRSRSFYHNV